MQISEIEVKAVSKATPLSPQARDLYRALRRDYAERLRSLIMSNDISEAGMIAGRRLPKGHPARDAWTGLDDALRELRRHCRGDGTCDVTTDDMGKGKKNDRT